MSSTQLEITRGDDRTYDIDVVDEDGAAVDITTFGALWFTAKRRISDADEDAVIAKALGVGVELDDVVTNRANVTIQSSDTESLPDIKTRLAWDVQVQDDLGNIVTIASGTLTVTPDVTRSATAS